jgi:hypothetical protein
MRVNNPQASGFIVCPLCEESWDIPKSPEDDTGALDAVLGLAPGTMVRQYLFNQAQDLERAIEEHMAKHTVLEWLAGIKKRDTLLDRIEAVMNSTPRRAAEAMAMLKQVAALLEVEGMYEW